MSEKKLGIRVQTSFDGKGFEDTKKSAEDTEKKVSKSAERMGTKYKAELEGIRRSAMIAFAAVAGAMGLAVKQSVSFEAAMAKISTLPSVSSEHLVKYSTELKNISRSGAAVSLAELAEATYQAISANVEAGDAMEFVNLAARAATAGFTDTATAVNTLTTILNSYRLSASEATRVSDIMIATQNVGKTTFGLVGQSIGKLASLAEAAKIPIEHMAAAIATVTKSGLDTNVAITGLRAVVAAFMRHGISAEITTLGFAGALQQLWESLDHNIDAFTEFVGVEAVVPALKFVGDNAASAASDLDKITHSAGTTDEAFGKMADGVQSKIDAMKGSIQAAAVDIGILFLPTVSKMITSVADVAKGLGDWAAEHPELARLLIAGTLAVTGFLVVSTSIALIAPKVAAGIGLMNVALTSLITKHPYLLATAAALAAIYGIAKQFNSAITGTARTTSELKKLSDELGVSVDTLQQMRNKISGLGGWGKKEEAEWQGVVAGMRAAKAQNEQTTDAIVATTAAIGDKTSALKSATEQININASALRDLMSAGLGVAEAMKLAQGAVLPTVEVEAGRSRLDLELTMQQEHNAVKLANEKAAADERVRIWNEAYSAEYSAFMERTSAIQAASSTAMQSILNEEMSGSQRLKAIWQSFASAAISQIGRKLWVQLAADQAGVASAEAAAAETAAIEQKSLLATLAKEATAIAAKIIKFYASLGPFAIPAAAATLVGIWAFVKNVKMQEGGLVPGYGFGDRIPALLEPGEFVVRREVTQRNISTLQSMNAGGSAQGGITIGTIQVNSERHLSYGDMLNIRRMVEDLLPEAIEKAVNSRSLRPGYAIGG